MAADFNKPVTTDSYVDLLEMLRANQEVLARMFASGITADNIPNGAVRFDAGKFQTWNGSVWVDVPVSVDGGGTGAQSALAARQALGTHDAANLTAGVMSADRVPGLDASKLVSGTLSLDTTGNAAGAPWSGITGKPAAIGAGATALEARQAIGATGNGLVLVWSGSASSLDLDTLPGGHPGQGWYVVSGTDFNYAVYIIPGLWSDIFIGVRYLAPNSISSERLVVTTENVLSLPGITITNGDISGYTNINFSAIYKMV